MNILNTKRFLLILLFICFSNISIQAIEITKKLKILFITELFPVDFRPYMNNQIKKFIDNGHDVWVYAKRKYDSALPKILANYGLNKKIQYGNEPKGQFDVILCQFGFLAPWVSAAIKKKKLKGKFVIFMRGSDISSHIKKNPHLYDQLFLHADLFLPVCHHFRNRLISLGCNLNKAKVIHSAILLNDFNYKPHAPNKSEHINILSVGQIEERKGFEYGIKAVVELQKRYPNIRYNIVGRIGSQSLMKKLQKLVKNLNAESFIHFAGRQPHHAIPSFLESADIFLLPCTTTSTGEEEGIPNALMEAMACGIPCVSTYHAGIPELIEDGVTGFLAPQKNVPLLVQKISILIEQPELCIEMGKMARAYVEREHNMSVEIERLEYLLKNLIKT